MFNKWKVTFKAFKPSGKYYTTETLEVVRVREKDYLPDVWARIRPTLGERLSGMILVVDSIVDDAGQCHEHDHPVLLHPMAVV